MSGGHRASEDDARGLRVEVHIHPGELSARGGELGALLERAVRRTVAIGATVATAPTDATDVIGATDATGAEAGAEGCAPSEEEEADLGSEPGAEAGGELSVALLADEHIRRLNREHLGHDRVTDVIAFPLWEEGEPVVGDVYVGLEQGRRQAAEEGVSLEEELVRLVVHGTLHVLGWNHPGEASEREASPMYHLQEGIVRAVVGEGEA